jgi:hypothetical protein
MASDSAVGVTARAVAEGRDNWKGECRGAEWRNADSDWPAVTASGSSIVVLFGATLRRPPDRVSLLCLIAKK